MWNELRPLRAVVGQNLVTWLEVFRHAKTVLVSALRVCRLVSVGLVRLRSEGSQRVKSPGEMPG